MSDPARDSALLVPVKRFADAKQRLRGVLDDERRVRLARWMAGRVIAAAGGLPVFVVCDDPDVATFARLAGAEVVFAPGRGLNRAVHDGLDSLRSRGLTRAVVAHADLPLVEDLSGVGAFEGFSLVPDRRADGTPVLGLPLDTDFRVAYGPGSFLRHLRAAHATHRPVRTLWNTSMSFDIDVPDDLADALIAFGTDGTIGLGTTGIPGLPG